MTRGSDAEYATDVVRMLWPAPWTAPTTVRGRDSSGRVVRDHLLLPTPARPRVLPPSDVAAAGSMLHRLGKGRSPLSRPMRTLLVRTAGSGMLERMGWPKVRVAAAHPADSIERHLGEALGADVRVGIILGTARANQKPVLQVYTTTGELLGYAKVGHNALTASLVDKETATLARLEGREKKHFRSPAVLSSAGWRDLRVLVVSPLAGEPGTRVTPDARRAAMRELAALDGLTRSALAGSAFWSRLGGDVASLPEPDLRARLVRAYDELAARLGAAELDFGAWHGDWGHWNMAHGDGVVQLWDWERFDAAVPLGFDEVHFLAQRVRPGTRRFAAQHEELVAAVPAALATFGLDPDVARATMSLYLLEISTRYALGICRSPTPALRRRHEWSTTLLEQLTKVPSPLARGGRP